DDDGAVNVVRLDDHPGIGAPKVLKIDVEGMEYDVLLGARDTIARHQPVLYVECPRPPDFARIAGLLNELGYAALAQFNATTTICFGPAADRSHAVNQQVTYLQYDLRSQLSSVGRRLDHFGQSTDRSTAELRRIGHAGDR